MIGQRVFNIAIENNALVYNNVDIVAQGEGKPLQAVKLVGPVVVTDGYLSIAFTFATPQRDNPKVSGIEVKLLKPHLAHAVSNGPYVAVDVNNDGLKNVSVDGSFSHTHAIGAFLVEYTWKEAATVLLHSAKATLPLSVGSHTISLTVKDSTNNTSTDLTTIVVNPFGYPSLLGLSPASGSITGGEKVIITGFGFTYLAAQTTVKFGLEELTGAAIQILDPNTIQVLSPLTIVGIQVAVSVRTPLAESNGITFTYVGASPIAFTYGILGAIDSPTAVKFGPDGKLYVGTIQGSLAKLTLNEDYTQVVNSVVSIVSQVRLSELLCLPNGNSIASHHQFCNPSNSPARFWE